MARLHPWIAVASAAVLVVSAAAAAPPAAAAGRTHAGGNRWMVVAKSDQDYGSLRADITAAGGSILKELPDIGTFVVAGGENVHGLASDAHASGVAPDHLEALSPPDSRTALHPFTPHGAGGGSHSKITPDPAMSLPGLMWNVNRIEAPEAWRASAGSPAVTVGVADTGLDYTHSELASQVVHVEDFTGMEGSPTICEQVYGDGNTDAAFAAQYGGPATTDWNGHGSWIGGNIAAALDGLGINGIAPKVKLVALKISQWCGYAYDSEILAAFTYAANNGIDVVSISFGGYLDLAQSDQALVYQQYVKTVAYAMRKGTLIVAAAGNEHVRVGAGGRVLSHGSLTTPGDEVVDYYGQYETPGGIPGVIDVSSTGNVVNMPTAGCTPDYPNATCKSTGDSHQPTGIGHLNQLAYYSNYGPRIDIAAPGGARKFNLPVWDGGGTPGFPVTTADGTSAWQDFSVTSNWALEIPCYYDLGPQFYPNDCYSTIQGTSMATPHVSAVVALLASRYPSLRHRPAALAAKLKASAQRMWGNTTQPLSASDVSAADLTGAACATGYCHLGGTRISDGDAYGAGLVDAGFGH
ncbi:MAG: S8 family serine peptidase [Candidatus Limnocylindrales bacterium]